MKCLDTGPYDAKIMLIGDCPNEQEERTGIPFSGSSGKLLRQMLSHVGINFNDCYVTNVIDFRPPNDDMSYLYNDKLPTPVLETSWMRLRDKIESIRPKVVIPLGSEALKAVCNKSNIDAYRGTWLSFRGINVLPTYHPDYVIKVYADHAIVELDLLKARNEKPAKIPHIILNPSVQQVVTWINNVIARDKAHVVETLVSFDIETIEKHIRCLGFATNTPDMNAIVIPFIKFNSSNMTSQVYKLSDSASGSSYWSPDEEVIVLDHIDKLFRSGIKIIGQNSVSFDEPILKEEFGLTIENHYMDTMHAWHCLYSEFPKGLDFLCSVLTNYHNYWSEKNVEDDISEWTYNAMDCIVTLEAAMKIEKELKETILCRA